MSMRTSARIRHCASRDQWGVSNAWQVWHVPGQPSQVSRPKCAVPASTTGSVKEMQNACEYMEEETQES